MHVLLNFRARLCMVGAQKIPAQVRPSGWLDHEQLFDNPNCRQWVVGQTSQSLANEGAEG
jgi:hypothetical protein